MSNSAAVFWRFAWKEYRVMRGFWLSLAVMAVLAQWIVSWMPDGDWTRATWLFGLALVVPGLYALACGATMFALEREEATYDFLSGLPATGRRLLSGKLGLGVLGVLAMFALLGGTAAYLAEWQLPEPNVQWGLAATCGLAWAQAMAWAILFSLLTSRPLKAACLAAVVLGMVVYPTSIIVGSTFHRTDADLVSLDIHTAAFPCAAAFAAIVFCVDFWLARRWLPGASGVRSRATLRSDMGPPRNSGLGRLVWHHLQQSVGMMAVLGGVAVVPIGLTVIASASQEGLAYWQLSLWCLSAILPSFIGSCVFLGDQGGQQFRFFAEHGVRPRYVWLSRQLVWMLFLLVILVVTTAIHGFALSARLRPGADLMTSRTLWVVVALPLVAAALGYAAGQLASMLVRSGITAAFVGLCVTAALGAWVLLMDFLGVSWLWSVMPIPVWLLWVTWLRAPDWILEHNGWKAWCRVGLSLAVPAAVLMTAVPLYRVYSVPAGGPGFSVEEFARSVTPEELATAEMYRQACNLCVSPESPDEQKTTNQKALALVMKATARPQCAFFDPSSAELVMNDLDRTKVLSGLLLADARRCEDAGQLEQAFDRYVAAFRLARHLRQRNLIKGCQIANLIEQEAGSGLTRWAAHPGQTGVLIRAAMIRLDGWHQRLSSAPYAVKAEYLVAQRRIRRTCGMEEGAIEIDASATTTSKQELSRDMFWSRLLSWEGPRALRSLDYVTRDALDKIDPFEAELAQGAARSASWMTEIPGGNANALGNLVDGRLAWVLARVLIDHERNYRAVQLALGTQLWKIEHGTWPATLDEVVQSPTFFSWAQQLVAAREELLEQDARISPGADGERGWPSVLASSGTASVLANDPFTGALVQFCPEGAQDVPVDGSQAIPAETPFLRFSTESGNWEYPIPIPLPQ